MELADVLDISDRRIQQLTSEGVFERQGRGQYKLAECVQAYCRYQVDLMRQKSSVGKLEEEQARLTKYKADIAAIDLEIKRNEVIPADIVGSVWQQVIAAARTRLLALPSSIKTNHPELEQKIINGIETQIRDILQEMSNDELPERYRAAARNSAETVGSAPEA